MVSDFVKGILKDIVEGGTEALRLSSIEKLKQLPPTLRFLKF
jgi:hypothetical protein